ncbi:hypothetical protein LWC35_05350 [Pseudonocardia kujensis]|uniref:hypothetical protein n=1 Tax=Pseudonocardia kujensis TaxID=1128675 RepID=UPI001E5C5894|nr:hypothetical protein [Pseudonocardia kujensis]MCE0762340.1 hypothetical protein [Pseudonocardia kujensis]
MKRMAVSRSTGGQRPTLPSSGPWTRPLDPSGQASMKKSASVHRVVRKAKAFPGRRLTQVTHIPTIDALRHDPVPTSRRFRARTEVVPEVRVTDVEVHLDHQIQELLDELRMST